MAEETFTIKAVREAGTRPNPHGGTLAKLYLDLEDGFGKTRSNVYCQVKPESVQYLAEGREVYGDLKAQDRDGETTYRLYRKQPPEGSQNRSAGAQGAQTASGNGNPQGAAPDRDRARQLAIIQQHSQTAAVEIVRLAGAAGKSEEEIAMRVTAVARSLTDDVLEAAKR